MNTQTGEHKVDLDAAIVGKENSITMNYKYLLDGVQNAESETIAVKLIDGMSPCLIQPHMDDGVESDYTYIVMPIRQ